MGKNKKNIKINIPINITIPVPNWWQTTLIMLSIILFYKLNINADTFIKILELIVKIKG